MSLKRICYVIPSLGVGGAERQLVHLLRGLIRDHELTVVCTRQNGALVGEVRRIGAMVHVLPSWSGWDFRLEFRLKRLFRNHRPDIVHTFLFGFELFANRAAHACEVPVIISTRRELAQWKKRRHIHIQQWANRYTDCIVANSKAVADFAIKQEQADSRLFRVIYNGVEPEAFTTKIESHLIRERYKIPFHTHVIGTVANFSPDKDYPLFIETAAELIRRRPDVHFIAVGTGPNRKLFEQTIRRRGFHERFTILSTLEELADIYSVMNVFVLCSKSEGFPNTILEAMAAGKPVVAPAVGGIPEMLQDGTTGRLVDSRKPSDFADTIEWFLDHPERRTAIGQHAQQHVQSEFPIAKMVNAHRRLYTELLEQKWGLRPADNHQQNIVNWSESE